MWGDVFPTCGDFAWGCGKKCQSSLKIKNSAGGIRRGQAIPYWQSTFSDLDQAQLHGPLDRGPAAVDVELAVNALRMGPDRT